MLKYKCPNCGEKTLTFKDKMDATSAKGSYCSNCKARVGMSPMLRFLWGWGLAVACSLTAIYIKSHGKTLLGTILLILLSTAFFSFIGVAFAALKKK